MTSETRAEAEARLPDAETRYPFCQACGDETEWRTATFTVSRAASPTTGRT